MVKYNQMVVYQEITPEHADLLFHALADATRRDIVRAVLRGERSVTDLARRYPMSFAAVQKHVAVLERAGLVTKEQRGRERIVHGRIEALRDVNRLMDELETVWRERMERFGEHLAESDDEENEGESNAPDRD